MPVTMLAAARRLVTLVAFAFIVAVFDAACAVSGTPLPSGSVLFQDDFSRSSSGWEIRHQTDSIFEYRDGQYAMLVLAPNASSWSTPGLSVGDVRIDVDAWQTGGPEDNLYGVICRYQDDDNFVFLVASGDGFAGIGEYRDGRRELLSGDAMLPAASISPTGYSNHLTADCLVDTLRLSINGTLVAEVPLASHASAADVGLIVGSYQEPGVEIVYDNYSVHVP